MAKISEKKISEFSPIYFRFLDNSLSLGSLHGARVAPSEFSEQRY